MPSLFVKGTAVAGFAVAVSIMILYGVGAINNCPLQHISVVNDLKRYQETLDPELCENIVNRIIELEDKCKIQIELVDCG